MNLTDPLSLSRPHPDQRFSVPASLPLRKEVFGTLELLVLRQSTRENRCVSVRSEVVLG